MRATKTAVHGESRIAERFTEVNLNGTAGAAAELKARLRGGNGAVILDKDGVFTKIDRQIEEALRREFERHHDPSRGIENGFDRNLVYKLFGIHQRYNDGATPILALIAVNLEARERNIKSNANGEAGISGNDILKEMVLSPDAVKSFDRLIAKHSKDMPSPEFVEKNMYWWREPGGFFTLVESRDYIDVYRGPNGTTSRDAVVALLEAGIKVSIITNAPNHDLHAAGFSEEDIRTRVSHSGNYVEGTVLVLTREHLGEERMKPHPYGLQHATAQLGVSMEHSIYVGDTISDIKFAMNAGAIPVGVESGMGSTVHLKMVDPDLRVFPDLQTLVAGLLR